MVPRMGAVQPGLHRITRAINNPKLAFVLALGLGGAAWAASAVTPFVGTPGAWNCRSVRLDPENVIGVLLVPQDAQTVSARILFRSGGVGRERLEVRMLKQDAELLRQEISGLLKRKRPRPIQVLARLNDSGACEIYQIMG